MGKIGYQKSMCMGCGICHSLYGIDIKRDSSGFAVPSVTKDNINNIKKVCPINAYEEERSFSVWGNYVGIYESWSTDEAVRKNASSGGVITAIAVYLLEKRIVDGIIHIGEDPENHQKTRVITSVTKDEVISHCGSRYCISTPLYDILDRVKLGKKYAFIGKPCDVVAIKRAMRLDEKLRDSIVFTMSFFCAGMPSDTANELLIKKMGAENKKLKSFRYRGNGWPGYATAVDDDGNEYSMGYAESWGGVLGRDVKKVCRFCLDGIGLYADVACADLWYLNDSGKPDFSEHDGRNLVFARTMMGKETIENASVEKYLCTSEYLESIEDLKKQQPHQFLRRTTLKYRLLPLKFMGKCVPKYSTQYMNKARKYADKGENYRAFIGSLKRALKGKI